MKVYQSYTNQERKEYKLKECVETLCHRLDIENGLGGIVDSVLYVLPRLCEKFGVVRGNLRDAVILLCIAKTIGKDVLYLSQKLDIHQKYIYKIQKLVIQIPEIDSLLSTQSGPFEYILGVRKYIECKDRQTSGFDERVVLPKVESLVKHCIDNDLLSKHSDITVGVTCMYFVLCKEGYSIDITAFSQIYNLSETILKKTYSALSIHLTRTYSQTQTQTDSV